MSKKEDYEIKIWPKNPELGSLLMKEGRSTIMAAIHSKVEETFSQQIDIFELKKLNRV
jgi:hypothetical protein